MKFPDYVRNISQDLLEQSKRIARVIDRAASAGEEGIRKVLDDLQPKAFGVARGFIFSSDSEPFDAPTSVHTYLGSLPVRTKLRVGGSIPPLAISPYYEGLMTRSGDFLANHITDSMTAKFGNRELSCSQENKC
jgi:hypothetical protein